MSALTRFGRELASLFFPRLCLVCEKGLPAEGKEYVCFSCRNALPYTDFHLLSETPVTDRLAGRIPLVYGGAYFYYRPGGKAQSVIHTLKYYNRPEIGKDLGNAYGQLLAEVEALKDVDMVVPVPIHPVRLHERGYNQAAAIGEGVAKAMGVRHCPNGLLRRAFVASQTKKGLRERAKNVATVFGLGKLDFTDRHLLLVDDIFTTGSTLEACAEVILAAYPTARISVAVLGITE